MELRVRLEILGHKVHQDHQVHRAVTEVLDHQDQWAKEVPQDKLEVQDPLARTAAWEWQDKMDYLVTVEPLDLLDQLDLLELLDPKENPVHPDSLDPKENPELQA